MSCALFLTSLLPKILAVPSSTFQMTDTIPHHSHASPFDLQAIQTILGDMRKLRIRHTFFGTAEGFEILISKLVYD
jgi:hypothetical protein